MFYKCVSAQDVFMCQVHLLPNGTIYQMLSLSVCHQHNILNVTKSLTLQHVLYSYSYSDNFMIGWDRLVSLNLRGL